MNTEGRSICNDINKFIDQWLVTHQKYKNMITDEDEMEMTLTIHTNMGLKVIEMMRDKIDDRYLGEADTITFNAMNAFYKANES